MAQLVGHVVDGEEVADGVAEAGAAAALFWRPTTPVRAPPPGCPSAKMADVVVRGADDLADDDALPRRRAAEDLGLREAAARRAGPFGADL